MGYGAFTVGAVNTAGYLGDAVTNNSSPLFDAHEPDPAVEAMARGTRRAADEKGRLAVTGKGGGEKIKQTTTGMDEPGQPETLALNPNGPQAIDPAAETVPSSMMAYKAGEGVAV